MSCHTESADLLAKKRRLADLHETKGQLCRQIGAARVKGRPPTELVERLKVVSCEAKALQKAIKSQLNNRASPAMIQEPSIPASAVLDKAAPAGGLEVHDLQPETRSAWSEYVSGHPGATFVHSLALKDALAMTFGHKMKYLFVSNRSGQIMGVLPLVQLKSWLFGNYVVSVPYFNYGGILADNRDAAELLLQAAWGWQRDLGADHVELRHAQELGLELPKRVDKVSFWLGLPESETALWHSFSPKVRAQIRRAEKETPEIEVGGEELIESFYRVFTRNMRDLGTPVYSIEFFRNLLACFPETARIVVVRLQGKTVGTAFLMGFGSRLEIPWASTLREVNHTGVNMFMYWFILKFAIRHRYQTFDFGRCTRNSSTYRFKKQWGARPIPLYWDYCLKDGGIMPGLNPDNPKFRLLIAAWKRLPVFVTRLLGPAIVRSLP